jgi:L-fucose mutarotase
MLKGISTLFSPELLATIYEMGHGDEIVLADAHFPAASLNANVIRADGLRIRDLLDAMLPLFELDTYDEHPILMMDAVEGDKPDPEVERAYLKVIRKHFPAVSAVLRLERFEFYNRAEEAFAIVATGELTKYGNIILKKGVTPVKV